MDPSLHQLIAAQHGCLTRRQARAAGLSRATVARRIADGTWDRFNDQVLRIRAAPRTDEQRVMATVLSAGSDAVATAGTALALHGVRGAGLRPVSVTTPRRPPRWALDGVYETFRLPEAHRTVVRGIPCATVARALFDQASSVGLPRLRRLTDAALAARTVGLEALDAVITDLAEHGRHGSSAMRTVVAERRAAYCAPASELEAIFLDLIRRSSVPEPDRQVDLGGALAWIGRVDFVWRAERLVVETDGRAFHDSPSDREADEHRDLRSRRRASPCCDSAGWT